MRTNLPSYVREAPARWYAAELSDEEQRDLSVRSLQLGWYNDEIPSAEKSSTFDPRFPDDTDIADVDAVFDIRYRGRGRNRRKQYLVRWSGVGNQYLQWLDEDNLLGAEEKVLEYLRDVLRHEQEPTN